MEQVTFRTDTDILYISVEGRVDAANAPDVEKAIAEIKSANAGKKTVIDADKLAYISSAGLRVILKLLKSDKELSIINVCPEVYEIFEMTGFTDMVNVEKAYRRMTVDGCELIAKGANGAVYRYDEETIIKVYFKTDALPEIQQERENARKAFVLGINTAIPYGIVRVGDGYGTVTELLRAEPVSKLIARDDQNLDLPAKYFIDMLKCIHSTEANKGDVPDMKEIALDWARFVCNHIPEDQGKKLVSLVEAVPESNIMLHGDYHTNNVMVQDGEPLLIDLDTLCMGHPIFELGSMFNAFVGFSEVAEGLSESFLGFSFDAAQRFWKKCLAMYLGTDDSAVLDSVEKKAMIIGYTRMLRRAVRRPEEADSPVRIARCKECLEKLLAEVDTLEF